MDMEDGPTVSELQARVAELHRLVCPYPALSSAPTRL